MNRKQTVVLGFVCLALATGSFMQGSSFGGVWSFLLTIVYPLLIVGLFVVFLLRDREAAPSRNTTERWCLAAVAGAIGMWLITLLVLVA